jgi:2-C-methyl-D-erythritol 4-phosphate cytidylyltransferase
MKNTAIILSGGTGARIGSPIPKQYIEVDGMPIICYCLKTFQACNLIDNIIIVAEERYFEMLSELVNRHEISKFKSFAPAGKTRQHSIYNALVQAKGELATDSAEENNVIIHDSARPLVNEWDITSLIFSLKNNAEEFDGITPVLPVKDTVYVCKGGEIVSLLNRDTLYAGQTPEIYKFGKYFSAHEEVNLSEIRGSSEIAIQAGMKIGTCTGNEDNFKITTQADLDEFILKIRF